ncbi:MAG: serine/threonine-protein phosphatase [Oscillospiraceae bacterium]|nr:serine/threonine-protein phosphatase [Oscillospiraceae bacterium]
MFEIACVVDKGNTLHSNDDRALINGHVVEQGEYSCFGEIVQAVVCDGVGGEKYGNEAAQAAVEHFASVFPCEYEIEKIEDEIKEANKKILFLQRKDQSHFRMATTIAGAFLKDNDIIAFNVGDTRIYRYRPPYIAQLSTDHSLIEELKKIGLSVQPEQEHVITRFLGGNKGIPDFYSGNNKVFESDSFLICSDGVSDVLDEMELETIMEEKINALDICRLLIKTAKNKGSEDNMTAIIIRRI